MESHTSNVRQIQLLKDVVVLIQLNDHEVYKQEFASKEFHHLAAEPGTLVTSCLFRAESPILHQGSSRKRATPSAPGGSHHSKSWIPPENPMIN